MLPVFHNNAFYISEKLQGNVWIHWEGQLDCGNDFAMFEKKMFDLDIFYSVYNITELDNTQSLPKPPEVQGHYTYTL